MNNECYLILDLLLEHCHKFGYDARGVPEIMDLFNQLIFENINDSTWELKKLLNDSIKENIDYLPIRYNYDFKKLMGNVNDLLIDYYDH